MNILDPHFDIDRNLLIEASAGTGKTFSIENLFVRLLIENSSINIENILVVTFTKAATRELRERIQSKLLATLSLIKNRDSQAPEYIQALFSEESIVLKKVERRIKRALLGFDEAQIFTIHAFCQNVINEFPIDMDVSGEDEQICPKEISKIVSDFMRSSLSDKILSSAQLKVLLKYFGNDPSRFENAFFRFINQGTPIEKGEDYLILFQKFVQEVDKLQISDAFSSLIPIAPTYKGVCNRQKEIKKEILEELTFFTSLLEREVTLPDFERIIEKNNPLFTHFIEENRVARCNEKPPKFLQLIFSNLYPIIAQARDPATIFATVASGVQSALEEYVIKEEKFRFDDLLKTMQRAVQSKEVIEKISKRYSVAIIDEFQDTDPIQWDIFQRLFLDNSRLYLVGDPKQAIYAFRQADIYTYLEAGRKLGNEARVTLDTNYRSEEALIRGLNHLFSHEKVPKLIHLPLKDLSISYSEVKASGRIAKRNFSDCLGAVHFCIAEAEQGRSERWPTMECEEEIFYPYIASEMQRLKKEERVPYSDWAILVKDRYQAESFALFCKKWNIPTMTQRNQPLKETEAFKQMHALLKAVLNLYDRSYLKIALCSRLFDWDLERLKTLDSFEVMATVLEKMYTLQKRLFTEGFSPFFEDLLESRWFDKSVREALLSQEEGALFYDHLNQVADLLIEYQSAKEISAEKLLVYLDELKESPYDEEHLKVHQDSTQDAAQIMTIHVSKGLEFPVVCALGVTKRTPIPRGKLRDLLIPVENKLVPSSKENFFHYKTYCKELDAEKARQLYVALTRAKHRLYIPLAIPSKLPVKIAPSEVSPIELYLANLKEPKGDLYSVLGNCDASLLCQYIDEVNDPSALSYSLLSSDSHSLEKEDKGIHCEVRSPPSVTISGKAQFSRSFSSIAESKGHTELSPPHDFYIKEKTIHTLPAGRETGVFLHEIFEGIPFSWGNQIEKIQEFVSRMVVGTSFEEWNDVISQMVYNTMNVSLGSFSLSQVSDSECYKEVEFLLKREELDLYSIYGGFSADYLKGVIDLLFRFKGKYYLLDWKSNWLGPDENAYKKDSLQKTMDTHQYHLQAIIYKEAVKKYLNVIDPHYSFGGTFYLFLRGITLHNSDNGIV